MKLKLLAVLALTMVGANAASITIGNITLGGSDVLLFDNAGNPLTSGRISLFTGVAPTTFEAAAALTNPISSFVLDGTTAPGGGLFSGAFSFANPDGGAVRNADLFVLITDGSGSQFGAYDIATVVNAGDTPTPFAADVNLTNSALITLGGTSNVTGDYSAIAGPGATAPAIALSLAAIPEPSAALLAGLALVGGLVRRRR